MTIKEISVRSHEGVFAALERLSEAGYTCFRGHRDYRWRLGSTLSRHYRGLPPNPLTPHRLDAMINHFIVNLASIGWALPFDVKDRRGRLEYARHFGLPSPLIDFSQSPYVALFFAFNAVRPQDAMKRDKAAIYCLKVDQLASLWAHRTTPLRPSPTAAADFAERVRKFRYDTEVPFVHGYDVGILKYFDTPASWNRRMQRQLGAFLYDTFDYATNGFSDLENFLEQPEPPGPDADPIITKLLVPHSIGRGIFERLELVNATGTHLYDSPEGAAQDVINGYNYGRKTGRAWDIKP